MHPCTRQYRVPGSPDGLLVAVEIADHRGFDAQAGRKGDSVVQDGLCTKEVDPVIKGDDICGDVGHLGKKIYGDRCVATALTHPGDHDVLESRRYEFLAADETEPGRCRLSRDVPDGYPFRRISKGCQCLVLPDSRSGHAVLSGVHASSSSVRCRSIGPFTMVGQCLGIRRRIIVQTFQLTEKVAPIRA